MTTSTGPGLTFGIYPGSAVGDTGPAGPPDRSDRISQALDQLQGPGGRPFIVRAYEVYADPGDTRDTTLRQTPAGYGRYLGRGRTLDLVAQYHSRSGNVDGYCAFIEALIERHGEHLATLQVGEEPNITGNPLLDGGYPRITEALIAGVRAAKNKARRSGHPGLKVGCNSSPLMGPAVTFFTDLTRAGILQRAIAAGEVRADIDIEMVIDLMVGAPVYRWLVTAQPVDADAARRVVDAVWESLRRPAS